MTLIMYCCFVNREYFSIAGSIAAVNFSPAPSLILGLLSALLLILYNFARGKEKPVKKSAGTYSSSGLHKTIEKQSKLNAGAAICAATGVTVNAARTVCARSTWRSACFIAQYLPFGLHDFIYAIW
ncbi:MULTISPECIES: hypothetical protein [unclassified Citrobacter]|uniref:hypothetical protein n=1 Tax=unclassified Citrobacter TaxID=2644389 RepID=UPI002578BBFC|nr:MULTISPECIES: hypothetical protein [unclassified Citrobacter]MDM2930685.1 hypothetical protein [Citrobacter sp. Cm046]MDM2941864.1 hypothetical protein [Citrobacter sp. Cm038]